MLCRHPLAPNIPPNILSSLSPILPPTRKPPSPMCGHVKLKRINFETEMVQITNPQIQPLLSMHVERPTNVTLDRMKYEFSKLFCSPSKTDFGSDEK